MLRLRQLIEDEQLIIMESGFLLIDKPAGITSHDVVDAVRRATGIRKVGHGGTLDPFATGLLVVAVGRNATKQLGEFIGKDKEYEAMMRLGAVSDSQDKDGVITEMPDVTLPSREQLAKAMKAFVGQIKQVPPMYSAKKIKGKKLYELARKGEEVEREPVLISIHSLELMETWPQENRVSRAQFKVHCGSGTYVRTLAHDIGHALGCGAYLTELRRTKIGDLRVKNAVSLDDLDSNNWTDNLT